MPHARHIAFDPIIQIDAWDRTEEVPTGSREKITVINPSNGAHFIFKYPKPEREHQIWSELIGSFLAGDILEWAVQHTSIAQRDGRIGNLLGYIFEPGNRGSVQESFIEGWTFCKQVDPDFDVGKGTRHTLALIFSVYNEILMPDYGIEEHDFFDFWARAFALDCLISNTDRHAENWAVIRDSAGSARMAPLYDNASSLGCGFDNVGLSRAFDEAGQLRPEHLDKQLRNGRHHVRIGEPAKNGSPFEEVCRTFLALHPDRRHWFEAAAAVEIEPVSDLLASIAMLDSLDAPYAMSERRHTHICAMLQIGRERIRNALR